MKLVICEKPSVARAIAAVIGAAQKKNGCFEGSEYLVSWCIGHLVQLAPAASYDQRFAKWCKEDLPIVPGPWQYVVCESTKQQFDILKRLMHDPRVDSLICATDAGREGELIFRLAYRLADCRKPFERLWISSMEDSAIREGFAQLKPSCDYDALYEAALCRAQADWLVGINATRLFSVLYGETLNIGRVMTPTLALLVTREAQIAAFEPAPFYTVMLDCGLLHAASARMNSQAEAQRIAALCSGKEARIRSLDAKERSEKPPKLYDLTTLQRDANRMRGYTAQQTLDYAQSLYEKQLITYPRTDSRYLTNDMEEVTRKLVRMAANSLPAIGNDISCAPEQVMDSRKVSDHHALLPTVCIGKCDMTALPVGERSLLTLISARLLCAVGKPSRLLETGVTIECEGVLFTAKGQQILEPGWKAVEECLYPQPAKQQEDPLPFPALNERMTFLPVTAAIKEGMTTPPKHFTEDTLLAAMENASAEIPSDEVVAVAMRKGLGTPATRAGILEKLVKVGFVERKVVRKTTVLLPTAKGVSLITVLPEELQSPALTAEWEEKLKQVETGESEASRFLAQITDMVRALVGTAQPVKDSRVLFADERTAIGTCPRCGAAVAETRKGFVCVNRACRFALWKNNRFFSAKRKELTASIAAALLKEGSVYMKGLYSEKTDKTYDATILMEDTGEAVVGFKLQFPAKGRTRK